MRARELLLLSLLTWRSLADRNSTWVSLAAGSAAEWTPRFTRSLVGVLRGDAVIVGGSDGNQALADVWASTNGSDWRQLSSGNGTADGGFWPPRFGACVVSTPDSLILLGGLYKPPSGLNRYLADVWSTGNGTVWSNVTSSAEWWWRGRTGHACLYFNSALWLFGGLTPAATNDVWRSGVTGDSWARVGTSAAWSPRAYASAAVFGGSIWISGGTDMVKPFADLWSSSNGLTWNLISGVPWPARDSACLIAWSGVLWLVGGRLQTNGAIDSMRRLLLEDGDMESNENADDAAINSEASDDDDAGRMLAASLSANAAIPAASDVWRSGPNASDISGWGLVEDGAPWGPLSDAGCVALPASQASSNLNPVVSASGLGQGALLIIGGQRWVNNNQLRRELAASRHDGKQRELPAAAEAYLQRYKKLLVAAATRKRAANDRRRRLAFGVAAAHVDVAASLPVPVPSNSVWSATDNLLCEESGRVCSGRGFCGAAQTVNVRHSSKWLSSAHHRFTNHDRIAVKRLDRSASGVSTGGSSSASSARSLNANIEAQSVIDPPAYGYFSISPLPYNCTCDEGWMDSRCTEPLCNPRTCIHGTCKAVNSSSSDSDKGESCVCTDPSQWAGPSCDIPICAPGCSPLHGYCTRPGQCDCEDGWAGSACTVQANGLRAVGVWVTAHVAGVYVSLTSLGFAIVLGGLMTSHFPGLLSACVGLPVAGNPAHMHLLYGEGKFGPSTERVSLLGKGAAGTGGAYGLAGGASPPSPSDGASYYGAVSIKSPVSALKGGRGGGAADDSSSGGRNSDNSALLVSATGSGGFPLKPPPPIAAAYGTYGLASHLQAHPHGGGGGGGGGSGGGGKSTKRVRFASTVDYNEI